MNIEFRSSVPQRDREDSHLGPCHVVMGCLPGSWSMLQEQVGSFQRFNVNLDADSSHREVLNLIIKSNRHIQQMWMIMQGKSTFYFIIFLVSSQILNVHFISICTRNKVEIMKTIWWKTNWKIKEAKHENLYMRLL
jgi:hypothetical protein